jgi:hypothetical protein
MKTVEWKVPEVALFAITRIALGAGVGLLLSTKLEPPQRRTAGLALLAVGLATTLPFALRIFGED